MDTPEYNSKLEYITGKSGEQYSYEQNKEPLHRTKLNEIIVARNTATGQKVVIKYQLSGTEPPEGYTLSDEAVLIRSLDHPGIIPIIDTIESDSEHQSPFGNFAIVMPYVPFTLRDKITASGITKERTGRLDIKKIDSYLDQITSALQYVHAQGIIHRDIKPDNILIDDEDHIYLTDFGIAKRKGMPADTTIVIGSPRYTSPEQISTARGEGHENISFQTDIYPLGLILYEMLTGEDVFPQIAFGKDPIQGKSLYDTQIVTPLPHSSITSLMRLKTQGAQQVSSIIDHHNLSRINPIHQQGLNTIIEIATLQKPLGRFYAARDLFVAANMILRQYMNPIEKTLTTPT